MFGRDVVIAGAYATRQARRIDGLSSLGLTIEAVDGALADAGLSRGDVDGIALEYPAANQDATGWAKFFDGELRWLAGGIIETAGIRGLANAAAAVAAGLCNVAVLGGARTGRWSTDGTAVGADLGHEFSDTWEAYVAPHFALVAQRYAYEFGLTSEQLAVVSATIRNHGHANPEAVMFGRGPYTVADILASDMISTPFRRLDLCLVAEGGAAIVLTTRERATTLARPAVAIRSIASRTRDAAYANPARLDEVRAMNRAASSAALDSAGVRIEQVDVFSLYDPNSFEILNQLETLGICAEGAATDFVADGAVISTSGSHPVNLDGGLLSYAWIGTQQMTLKLIDCVRQLRGTAAAHQLRSPQVALATNAGSAAQHYDVAVLGRA